jgi:hypothetical protein
MGVTTWWSWALFLLGITGLWVMTTHPKIGPWFNIVGQTAWFTYGAMTRQWGFVASSIGYVVVFSRSCTRPTGGERLVDQGEKEQGQVLVPPVQPARVPEPSRRAGESHGGG